MLVQRFLAYKYGLCKKDFCNTPFLLADLSLFDDIIPNLIAILGKGYVQSFLGGHQC